MGWLLGWDAVVGSDEETFFVKGCHNFMLSLRQDLTGHTMTLPNILISLAHYLSQEVVLFAMTKYLSD